MEEVGQVVGVAMGSEKYSNIPRSVLNSTEWQADRKDMFPEYA
jgi:hypothetical protein